MSLKSCKSCGNIVDSSAKACPTCGAVQKRKLIPIWLRVLFGLIALYMFASDFMHGWNSSSKPTSSYSTSQGQKIITVTITQLVQDYNANVVNADSKYKGKQLELTAQVKDIGKNIIDIPYVSFGSIYCIFNNNENDKLLKEITKGQTITITGKGGGQSLLGTSVEIHYCKIKSVN